MEIEPELIESLLSQSISKDGKTVRVDIYSGDPGRWILEVVDQFGNSTVWDDQFASDEDALAELHRTLDEEGIASLIGPESGMGNW